MAKDCAPSRSCSKNDLHADRFGFFVFGARMQRESPGHRDCSENALVTLGTFMNELLGFMSPLVLKKLKVAPGSTLVEDADRMLHPSRTGAQLLDQSTPRRSHTQQVLRAMNIVNLNVTACKGARCDFT